MTDHNPEPRFDGRSNRTTDNGRVLAPESDVLPEEFLDRLRGLKEASELTWSGFADIIGVDRKQLRRWRRNGVEPSGGPMLALIRFASRVSGGLDILMGDGFQMNLWAEEDDQEEEET